MFDQNHKIFSIQIILMILVVLVVLNIITIYLQSSVTANVVTIKQDHFKSSNEICDVLVRRYERRAMDLVYKNLTINDLSDTVTKDVSNIPNENIVYVKMHDETILPVGYFDEKGFLQTLIMPDGYVEENE